MRQDVLTMANMSGFPEERSPHRHPQPPLGLSSSPSVRDYKYNRKDLDDTPPRSPRRLPGLGPEKDSQSLSPYNPVYSEEYNGDHARRKSGERALGASPASESARLDVGGWSASPEPAQWSPSSNDGSHDMPGIGMFGQAEAAQQKSGSSMLPAGRLRRGDREAISNVKDFFQGDTAIQVEGETEEEAMRGQMKLITALNVLAMGRPTADFLCVPEDNKVGLHVLGVEMRNHDTKKVLHRYQRSTRSSMCYMMDDELSDNEEEDLADRFVSAHYDAEMLRGVDIAKKMRFSTKKEVHQLRVVERFFFRDRVLWTHDFQFGFCMPNSINTWETVYSVPDLADEEVEEIINHGHEAKSDTFFFVENALVMHIRGECTFRECST